MVALLSARDEARFALYERTVLSAAHEVHFVARAFEHAFGETSRGDLRSLREDFAGTAAVSFAFTRAHADRRALAVDQDASALDYGRRVHGGALSTHVARRVSLVQGDVCTTESGPHDAIHVGNFSIGELTDDARARYLTACFDRLGARGVLVVDALTGTRHFSPRPFVEEGRAGEVGYTFAADATELVDAHGRARRRTYRLSFTEPQGARLEDAFVYDWQLVTVPALVDEARASGFVRATAWRAPIAHDGERRGALVPSALGEGELGEDEPHGMCTLVFVKDVR